MYMDIAIPDDCFELVPKLKQTDRYELATINKEPLLSLLYPFRIQRKNIITFSLFNNKEKSLHKRREEIKKYSIITYNRFGKKTYSLPKGINLDISA